MLFISFIFYVFLAIFLWLWRSGLLRRDILLVAASLLFYSAWNPVFTPLPILAAGIDYQLSRPVRQGWNKTACLTLSILFNVGVLAFFKYGGFLARVGNDLFAQTGLPMPVFPIIAPELPLGISFYTFKTLAYAVDVFRGRVAPARSFLEYLGFVSFFPGIIAGPIDRFEPFRNQLEAINGSNPPPTRLAVGFELFLRGLMKKTVIADNLAAYSNQVYGQLSDFALPSIIVAMCFYTLQIYCDFSGYTDMARGIGKSMGLDMMENFNYPYFARSMREFWQRWHMSLSTWFRDYLYIPLGGNRHGQFATCTNLFLTMLLCGLWHGANYTFIVWGAYHGLLLAGEKIWNEGAGGRWRLPGPVAWGLTLAGIVVGWHLFRVESVNDLAVTWAKCRDPLSGKNLVPGLHYLLLGGLFCLIHAVEFRAGRRITFSEWPGPAAFAGIAVVILFIYLCKPAYDQIFIYATF